MKTYRSRLFLFALTAASYAVVTLLSWASGMPVSLDELPQFVLFIALATGALSFLCGRWGMPRLQAMVDCVGCGFLLAVPIIISTYLAIRVGMPLADETLAAADAFLGLDWDAFIAFVDANWLLATIFNEAYRTFNYQLLIWPIALASLGREVRAYQMVSSYAVLCLLSSLISIWWPAVGTYTYYNLDHTKLEHLDPKYGYFFLQQFNAVRDNPGFVWSLKDSAGILTFPSVHAAVAVLCAWAAWDFRVLRYPALALNIAMALSAVPSASHYLIDVLAGAGVAAFSIASVGLLTKEAAPKPGAAFALRVRSDLRHIAARDERNTSPPAILNSDRSAST